jgi:hypothetical protein
MEKYNVCRNTSMDSKLVKAYHAMFRTGSHGAEEGSDILILPIQMVQVSFAKGFWIWEAPLPAMATDFCIFK